VVVDNYDLEMTYDTYLGYGNQTVGLRFTNVNIPTGANILNSWIQFTTDEVNTDQTDLTIQGQDDVNPTTFLESPGNVSSRPRTSASVSWSPAPWTFAGEQDVAQKTPALNAIVQEIVDKPGFDLTSPMVFIIEGTGERTAETYDGDQENAATLCIEYSINTNSNSSPTASIVLPQNGTQYNTNDNIIVEVNANDSDGYVASVAYYLNGNLMATEFNAPFSYNMGTLPAGQHTVEIVATDNDGATVNDQVTFTVFNVQPPVVDFDEPNNFSNVDMGSPVNLRAIATDLDGNVVNVSFYHGNPQTMIADDTASPYESVWMPTTSGQTNLYAIATDDDGLSSTSSITINVNETCNVPINFTASNVTESTAVISWQGDTGNSGYTLQFRPAGTSTWNTTTSFVNLALLNGLSTCTQYEYRVKSECSQTSSTYSAIYNFNTSGCQIGCDAIQGLFVSNLLSNSAFINWDISAFSTYTVHYRNANTQNWLSFNTQFPMLLLLGLNTCTEYEWYVETHCSNGETSVPSPVQSFTTTGCKTSEEDLLNQEVQEISANVYPNPMQDYLQVEIANDTETASVVSLIDVSGRLIAEKEHDAQSRDKLSFKTANLEKGIYFLKIESSKGILSKKLIKE